MAKVVYVRDRNKRKEYLRLISTDTTLGELFLYFADVMSDITWIQAVRMLRIFRTKLTDNSELSEEKISELVEVFMDTIPTVLRLSLQVA